MQSSKEKNHDYFQILRENKNINELAISSNKLSNNFTGRITSSVGPDVARGQNLHQSAVYRCAVEFKQRSEFIFKLYVSCNPFRLDVQRIEKQQY
jgi:hypothetical protein